MRLRRKLQRLNPVADLLPCLIVSLQQANYFELFSLPVSFQLENTQLEVAYKKLQSEFHPDRVVNADDRTRVQALQQTSMINDAYATLKSPLKRAAYLLKLAGVDAEEHNQLHLDEAFLIQQMEMREALASLIGDEDLEGLDAMKDSIDKEKTTRLASFETQFTASQFVEAKSIYNQLQFIYKLLDEIDKAEEKLLDY